MIMKRVLGPIRNPLQMGCNITNAFKHQYYLQKSALQKLQIGKAQRHLLDGQTLGKIKILG